VPAYFLTETPISVRGVRSTQKVGRACLLSPFVVICHPHMINVEVVKNSNENTGSVMRRFTKKMQGSGVLKRVRKLRYYKRNTSMAKRKKELLLKLKRQERYQELLKLGLLKEKKRRR